MGGFRGPKTRKTLRTCGALGQRIRWPGRAAGGGKAGFPGGEDPHRSTETREGRTERPRPRRSRSRRRGDAGGAQGRPHRGSRHKRCEPTDEKRLKEGGTWDEINVTEKKSFSLLPRNSQKWKE